MCCNWPYWQNLLINIAISTAVWVTVTILTKPVEQEKLARFYAKVRPSPFGWKPVAGLVNTPGEPALSLHREVVLWGISIVFIYALTFGIGKLFLLYWAQGACLLFLAAVTGGYLYRKALR